MCKKLILFSAAFGLGISFIWIFSQSEQHSQKPTILTQNTSDDSQNVQPLNPIAEFFDNFKKSVAENDKKAIASSIKFPVEVVFNDYGKKFSIKTIKNEAEFLLNYDRIFGDSFKESISQTKTGKFSVSTGGDILNVKSGIVMKTFGLGEMPKDHQFTKDDIKITQLKRK